MKILRCLAIYTTLTLSVLGDSSSDRMALLKEAARTSGIQEALVLNPMKRSELVKSLQRRIEQGYFDENVFKIAFRKRNPPKTDYEEIRRPYLETRAKGLDSALFLASEFGCVELVPLLVKRGDMEVLDLGVFKHKNEVTRAVRAIVDMGLNAALPLFDIVERSPDPQERYYALSALQMGQTAWKDKLDGKGLAERMAEHCDTSKTTVQLAISLLKGYIHDARTAAGEDLNSP